MQSSYQPEELYLCQVIKANNIETVGNMTRWKPQILKYVVCQWPNSAKNNDIFVEVLTQEKFFVSSFAVSKEPGHDVFVRVVSNLSVKHFKNLTLEDIKKIEAKANKDFAKEQTPQQENLIL